MPNVCAVPKEEAAIYLRNVSPLWRAFWLHMHLMARNLQEFADGLATISDEVFAYHVSGDKNDLSRWVREVIGDAALANDLGRVTSAAQAAEVVRARIAELRAAA